MSEYASPSQVAKDALEDECADLDIKVPVGLVDSIFAALEEPDGPMIRAGVSALETFTPNRSPRDLVRAIWCAMLREAQS